MSGRASCARAFRVLPKIAVYEEKSWQKYEKLTSIRIHIRPLVSKPRKSSYPLPPEKSFERVPRALECTDRAETWTTVSGRASCARAFGVLPKSAVYEEKSWRKYEKLTNILVKFSYFCQLFSTCKALFGEAPNARTREARPDTLVEISA